MNSWRSRPPNRRCVCHFYYCPRLLIALATIFRRKLKNIDISQAFLQSSNLNDRDRLVIISPPTITLPWKREFPPYHVDIKLLPRPRMGFLSDRPLYGGRDAHMRRFIAFSTIIRKADYRQLQTDVCVFSRTRKRGGGHRRFSRSSRRRHFVHGGAYFPTWRRTNHQNLSSWRN